MPYGGSEMMYRDKFVLSVLHKGSPLREFGPQHERKVSMPFNSEYVIRLRNKNDRACTARVFVDGANLSSFGDIIIHQNSFVDLERFVVDSMNSGKKLKFVSLDHPSVNDPHSSENGIIKVEFRMAKRTPIVWVDPYPPCYPWNPSPNFPNPSYPQYHYVYGDNTWTVSSITSDLSAGTRKCSSSKGMSSGGTTGCSVNYCTSAESGATTEGGHSSQSFSYSDIDVEFAPSAVLKLKIVGVKGEEKIHSGQIRKRFCTHCGSPRRGRDKFCGNCGHRF